MTAQNGFNDLVFLTGSGVKRLGLGHLENLSIEIEDFQLENGSTTSVTVHMRPTNHLYSRRFDPSSDNEVELKKTGELLLRFEHDDGNYQAVKRGTPILSTEKRVFCDKKYAQSKLFPAFVESLKNAFQQSVFSLTLVMHVLASVLSGFYQVRMSRTISIS